MTDPITPAGIDPKVEALENQMAELRADFAALSRYAFEMYRDGGRALKFAEVQALADKWNPPA